MNEQVGVLATAVTRLVGELGAGAFAVGLSLSYILRCLAEWRLLSPDEPEALAMGAVVTIVWRRFVGPIQLKGEMK